MAGRIIKAWFVLAFAGTSGAAFHARNYLGGIIMGLIAIAGMVLIHMELSRGTPESESK